jgi:2-polyprenyl-3-methyl-5-hydroxy-6-metoxy-1,4-benzoquinol methylase
MYTQHSFWENIYSGGSQLNKYPYDQVVSFVFRNRPPSLQGEKEKRINILELGCGAGNNLWFAAREGFNVTGIDISESAIAYAKKRFSDEGLTGTFICGDFSCVNKLEDRFDLVIDRSALGCTTKENAKKTIADLRTIMNPSAKMFFNPFSDKHSSCASGVYSADGMTVNMQKGISTSTEIYFYSRRDIFELFEDGFIIESLQHMDLVEMVSSEQFNLAEWRVIAVKNER